MADSFGQLEGFIGSALQAIAPASRAKLFRAMVAEMRKRNQARIAQQVDPDGEAWEPRKRDAEGNVRKKAKLLVGLRATRRLVLTAGADGASVDYRGSTARIAAVHHHGRGDKVAKDGPRVTYPARPLLGIADTDIEWLRRRLLDHIADALP